MSNDTGKIFDDASEMLNENEVFKDKASDKDFSAEDIFAGGEEILKIVEGSPKSNPEKTEYNVDSLAISNKKVLYISIGFLSLMMIMVFGVVIFTNLNKTNQVIIQTPTNYGSEINSDINTNVTISGTTDQYVNEAASLEMAANYFKDGDYENAYKVYRQLDESLDSASITSEFLKDYLKIKLAISIDRMGNSTKASQHLTLALQSRSPVVQALANYHLMIIDFNNHQYLRARHRAYRAIGLIGLATEYLPNNLEADCYFVMAESLTNQVRSLNGDNEPLPGKLWSDSLEEYINYENDQEQIAKFLRSGLHIMAEATMSPSINFKNNTDVATVVEATSFNCPLEQFVSKFASEAKINVKWNSIDNIFKNRPISAYLKDKPPVYIAEVVAGSAGLTMNMDSENLSIYDPQNYNDLAKQQHSLAEEAISVWKKFLIRFRGDHRAANAHYALGMLNLYSNSDALALAEYKLLSTTFSHSSLAPYAVLNSSIIKTNIKDYNGAIDDLTELLLRYPDCQIADKATLKLAQATLNEGHYSHAANLFKKVFNINVTPEYRFESALGAGIAHYELKEYKESQMWLTESVIAANSVDYIEKHVAYLMLGKVYNATGEHQKAADAFRYSLNKSLPKDEFIKILLDMAETEIKQQRYVIALNILENINYEELSQEETARVLVVRASILREIELVEEAITILVKNIEYISSQRLRAKLGLELGKCYMVKGNYTLASKELANALNKTEPGLESNLINLSLAECLIAQQQYKTAINTCREVLNTNPTDEHKQEAMNLVGIAYTKLGDFENASLAYAGKFEETE